MKVCVTGATGFIGSNLIEELEQVPGIEIVALSRKVSPAMDGARKGSVTWRRCNGFSLLDVERGVAGCEVLIYLIHSMLPSTSLSQGSFRDFDLYLADNFAKAAQAKGIKKIIFLSGLIPSQEALSTHLKSRLEVEQVLAQYGGNLTVLRAGLIVGRNGSSFKILERLIKRLPALVCPTWTRSKTQPIDLCDVLATLRYCLDHIENLKPTYDIGGPTILTYREMLVTTAKCLGKVRPIIDIPVFSTKFSRLWVSNITSQPSSLVYPLIESLRHDMVVDKNQQLLIPGYRYKSFTESLALGADPNETGFVRSMINYQAKINLRILENVTSIQRVAPCGNKNAEEIANLYFSWLPSFLMPLIAVDCDGPDVRFRLWKSFNLLILKRSEARSSPDRVLYYVTGGILARKQTLNGRLEFRSMPAFNSVIIALLDFRPALPWFIYKYSQAIIHVMVMRSFSKHLQEQSR